MNTKLLFLFLSLLSIQFFGGCKSSPVEPGPSKTEILTGTIWRLQKALALGPSPGQTTDVTYQFPYLSMTFSKDGKYSTPIHNGTWQFTSFEAGMLFDKDTATQISAKIIELTATLFHFIVPTATPYISSPIELTFTPQSASNDLGTNFETLWKGYDANYSFFLVKGIDWDLLHSTYRSQVTSQTNDLQLFQIMSSMLANLKDGHVNLITPFATYYYSGWWTPYPANFLGVGSISRYLKVDYGYSAGNLIRFGKTTDSIGYLYISSFSQGSASQWSSAIDAIMDSLKYMRAIVVDLRSNGGGSDTYSTIVASRFADGSHVFSYVRWRNGPSHSDFTDYQPLTIGPNGPRRFTDRVAVLTNRRSFSSTEETVLMFKSFPYVTTIGDTTGGGSGNPVILQLPNQWTYWVPRWIEYTADLKVYEGIGLAPDIPVWISRADSLAGRDAILERAIQYLR